MWLYLHVIGKSTEKFINEINLWTFDRTDFKNAVACLVFDDDQMDQTALKLKELISRHFHSDRELVDWSRDAFAQVTWLIRQPTLKFGTSFMKCNLQHASSIVKNSCLYISINAHNKKINALSGLYDFKSMIENTPIYMREDEAGKRSCLVYYPGLADRKGPLWEKFTCMTNAHWILNDENKEFFVCKEKKGTF